MTSLNDYPAVFGHAVTEGHARICRERGHATFTQNGKVAPWCPRCGDNRTGDMMELTAEDRKRLNRAGVGYRRSLRGVSLDVIDDDYGDDVTVWNIALDGAHAAASWKKFRAAIERHYRGDLAAAEQAAFDEIIGRD